MSDCVRRLVEASKNADGIETLSQKEAAKLIDEVKAAAEVKSQDGSDFFENVVAELTARKVNKKLEGDLQKRNALKNIIIHKELGTKIDDFIGEGLSLQKSLQALTVGVQGLYKAGRYSLDTKVKAIQGKYIGGLTRDLEAADLLPIINQKALQPEIEKELWALGSGKGGVTKSKEALEIAKIIYKYNEATRLRQNRAGANIGKLETFTATQSHDRVAIRKAGYEEWSRSILPLLDEAQTFKGADKDEFLKSVYEVLTTGISKKTIEDEKLFEFKGPANLAKKVSRARVLHFKDAESSIQYRDKFGKRDFMEGVLMGLDKASRNIGLMETFGTNPDAMFERILKDAKNKYRSDENVLKGFKEPSIRNFYNEASGKNMIPESPNLAQIGSVLRAIQSMSKLGGSVISAVSDIPIKAAELQNQGRGFLESYGTSISDIRLQSKDRKEMGALLGVYGDGMSGAIYSRFSANDDLPGAASKLMRLFFKLNGLSWWTDSHKIGMGMAMSHHLALYKGKAFDNLGADTKRLFTNYGIDSKDWDLIRATATKQLDDREYITPDAIQNIEGLTQKQKDTLEDKLRAYFIDRTEHAVLEPGARENVYTNFGYARGTAAGEFFRTIMQFKSFPITMVSKTFGKNLYGKGKADIPALIQTSIMTTLFGYLAMSGKDLLKGREPRPLDEPKTWAAAFTQGGGAGILGDFILGDYSRYGKGLTTTLAGPTFSTLDDLAALYSAAKNGDDLAAKSLKFTINHMPFANLFYLRPALDYMFIYELQEAANPGYLRRMEKRIEQENNQKFLIKPSSVKE